MRFNKREFDLIRASKCMTTKELVKKAGVSYSSICKDGGEIGAMTLGKIARVLEVDPRSIVLPDDAEDAC